MINRPPLALRAALLLTIAPLLAAPALGGTLYVDPAAVGAGNGSSWDDAFRDLQSALAAAPAGSEIHVAAGTYFPDEGPGQVNNSRLSTFRLKSGVALLGGFPRGGGPADGRNPAQHRTILSGNIGSTLGTSDDAYHVVTGTGVDTAARLDGFVITAGRADSTAYPHNSGGGLLCDTSGSPSVVNCVFERNHAKDEGGALYSKGTARPVISHCSFLDNSAVDAGGAVSSFTSIVSFTACRFAGNRAEFAGAVHNAYSKSTFTGCVFEANLADYGGAVYNFDFSSQSDAVYINCIFAGNKGEWGGAMYCWSASPILRNCTFQGNHAIYDGGAFFNTNGWGPYLYNTIVWNNQSRGVTHTVSASVMNYRDEDPIYYQSLIANSGGSGVSWKAGIGVDRGGNMDFDPRFVGPQDPAIAPAGGGNFQLKSGSPAIDAGNNTFVPVEVVTDQSGAARIHGAKVDLGALEFQAVFIDLQLASSTDREVTGAPGSVTHRITLRNPSAGAATAVGIDLVTEFPAGVTADSAVASAGSFHGSRWSIPRVDANETVTLAITYQVPSSVAAVPDLIQTRAVVASLAQERIHLEDDITVIGSRIVSPAATVIGVSSSPVLSRQSGLLTQEVVVTNGNLMPMGGFRLSIGNLPGDTVVFNAHGVATNGVPYVDCSRELGSGESVTLTIEFFSTTRGVSLDPFYWVDAVFATAPEPPAAASAGAAVERVMRMADGAMLIAFASRPGRSYAIEYSPDLNVWHRVTPSILASSTRVQWTDSGPPKTSNHPSAVPSRYYRIVEQDP